MKILTLFLTLLLSFLAHASNFICETRLRSSTGVSVQESVNLCKPEEDGKISVGTCTLSVLGNIEDHKYSPDSASFPIDIRPSQAIEICSLGIKDCVTNLYNTKKLNRVSTAISICTKGREECVLSRINEDKHLDIFDAERGCLSCNNNVVCARISDEARTSAYIASTLCPYNLNTNDWHYVDQSSIEQRKAYIELAKANRVEMRPCPIGIKRTGRGAIDTTTTTIDN